MYFVSMYIYFIFAFKRVETISNSNIDKLKLVGHPALVIKLLSMSLYSYLKNQSSITLFWLDNFAVQVQKFVHQSKDWYCIILFVWFIM
jgi:hypothetical protein